MLNLNSIIQHQFYVVDFPSSIPSPEGTLSPFFSILFLPSVTIILVHIFMRKEEGEEDGMEEGWEGTIEKEDQGKDLFKFIEMSLRG